jgi:hypothetical protein
VIRPGASSRALLDDGAAGRHRSGAGNFVSEEESAALLDVLPPSPAMTAAIATGSTEENDVSMLYLAQPGHQQQHVIVGPPR